MVFVSIQLQTYNGLGATLVPIRRGSHQVVHRYVLMVKDDLAISFWRKS